MDVPVLLVTPYLLNSLGRKVMMTSSLLTAAVCLLLSSLIPEGLFEKEWLIIALAITGKMAVGAAFDTGYVWTSELFPTVIRNSALSACSSMARYLAELLPGTLILHQDSYYRKETDPCHARHPATNCIDWEVLEAFHIDKMLQDAKDLVDRRALPPTRSHTASSVLPLSSLSLNPTVLEQLKRVSTQQLLLLEGICMLNHHTMSDMCQLKFFLEIDKEACRTRRAAKGEWGEDEDCWSESPEYFEEMAWPGYCKIVEQLR